jgi:hypothetical protein
MRPGRATNWKWRAFAAIALGEFEIVADPGLPWRSSGVLRTGVPAHHDISASSQNQISTKKTGEPHRCCRTNRAVAAPSAFQPHLDLALSKNWRVQAGGQAKGIVKLGGDVV